MARLFLLLLALALFNLSNGTSTMAYGRKASSTYQLHVPLLRRFSGREDNASAMARKRVLETKYGGDPENFRRASGYNLLVNHYIDTNYYGTIFVGTPPVAYNVFLDTGSADLWLADASCSKCDEGIAKLNKLSSSTFTSISDDFELVYGIGQVSGTFGRDAVQLAGMEIRNQVFGVVDTLSDGFLDGSVSGVLGLAWRGLSPSGTTPLWQTLFESGVLDEPLMAFHLTDFRGHDDPSPLLPGGTFSLGAVNATLFTGEVDYQDMPSEKDFQWWILPISKLTVNGAEVSLPSGEESHAVIDTGTTLVSGPEEYIAELYAHIPGAVRSGGEFDGYYTYPCHSAPTVLVTFSFGTGPEWPITPSNFIFARSDTDTCIGVFVPSSRNIVLKARWIVGIAFLNNVYSVFRANPPSIGFAALSEWAKDFGESAVLPTPTIGSEGVSVTGSGTVGKGLSAYERLGNSWWTWVSCTGGLVLFCL